MKNKEQLNYGDIRRSRLAGIRASLKDVSILNQTTAQIKLKINSKASLKTEDSERSEHSNHQTSSQSLRTTNILDNKKQFNTYASFVEKFDFLEKIGEGCNGCVYKCQNKKTKQIYAVKKIKVDEQLVSQLNKIFISIQKLRHPTLCEYKGLYYDQKKRFGLLVMEYFPFPNLEDCQVKSEGELKEIVRQIIAGLQYLHKHNICHRDIKPENVLYDQASGKIKIIDFGIAKKTFSRGVRRDMLTIIGTNFYFAPEIYLGGGYDERIDIWALGIMIYKLIAGYTPFESEFHQQTISNITKGQFTFDEEIWSNYSSFLKDFISRILKQKSKRMTLAQCSKHLWLHKSDTHKMMKKLVSFSIELSQQFKKQMKNSEQAISKQEGHSCAVGNYNEKINLFNFQEFQSPKQNVQKFLC